MHTRNFLPFLTSLASASVARRTIESDAHLYVYGVGINGFSVYSDSNLMAVIADNDTAVANGLKNTTWSIDTTGSAPWNVTITNSTETGQFYILHDSADHQGAGFNKTAPTGAATTGFVLYGSTVEYSTGTTYESQFYARNSSNNIWNLMWNTDASTLDDGVPVVLKTIAPRLPPIATTTSV
ncbi:hypothetical protein EKO27_g6121 [Xylaria grammica]|uniref:Uncharacterized protein n=1 Tax=Xylaria grammica TaxID=363999 RepID=A0A439D3L2_9PEZI|nr:hypothetical protein F5X98DRAFT_349958 [Xylaria grammica]RWA08984.1 hypothetical protein EKO27_g6121 [Xylaria grammica]GAW12399.1 hypothetical protein ANO14919_017650 [Xylariales sp. No.14919]